MTVSPATMEKEGEGVREMVAGSGEICIYLNSCYPTSAHELYINLLLKIQ